MRKHLLPTHVMEREQHHIVMGDTANRAQGVLLSRDGGTRDLMTLLEGAVIVPVGARLGSKVHETILAIDSELSIASDTPYRNVLIKTAYALRNLEEHIQRSIYCQG